jgi:hypothetical protein
MASWNDTKPSTALLTRALLGDPVRFSDTKRGHLLAACRAERALRAWMTPGCYGWLRSTDRLSALQVGLMELRIGRVKEQSNAAYAEPD